MRKHLPLNDPLRKAYEAEIAEIKGHNSQHWVLVGLQALKLERQFLYGTVLEQGKLEVLEHYRLVLHLEEDGELAHQARAMTEFLQNHFELYAHGNAVGFSVLAPSTGPLKGQTIHAHK